LFATSEMTPSLQKAISGLAQDDSSFFEQLLVGIMKHVVRLTDSILRNETRNSEDGINLVKLLRELCRWIGFATNLTLIEEINQKLMHLWKELDSTLIRIGAGKIIICYFILFYFIYF